MPPSPLFFFLAVAISAASSADSGDPYKYSVDLSYQPLAKHVNEIFSSSSSKDVASIDLTGSMLGDQAVSNLNNMENLWEFKAPMNRLSSSSAIKLFEEIVQSKQQQPMQKLDLGFNPLFLGEEQKQLRRALRTLLASSSCPLELCLECTGLDASGCRAMAKGLISRQADIETVPLISLNLANNPDIGDAGAVAIAAALRTVALDTLDLSKCNIGNAGAEALALIFDKNVTIRRLVMSHNKIGNLGLSALCRAVTPDTLELDGNDLITDTGMNAVSDMIASNKRSPHSTMKLSLRSCNLRASGAERIGKALRRLLAQDTNIALEIDLSGNPLGILRGNTKGDSKYSASRLKSTVSATASAYMSQGMNLLKKGFGSTIESDDEEEQNDEQLGESDDSVDQDRCGLKALANAFLYPEGEEEDDNLQTNFESSMESRCVTLGLRRTFCDTAGAEALAALLVSAKYKFCTKIALDVALNPVLDEEMVDALHGENDDLLHEMSDRHLESMEILQQAKNRARLAAQATSARLRRQEDLEDEWGSIGDNYLYSDHSEFEEEDDDMEF